MDSVFCNNAAPVALINFCVILAALTEKNWLFRLR